MKIKIRLERTCRVWVSPMSLTSDQACVKNRCHIIQQSRRLLVNLLTVAISLVSSHQPQSLTFPNRAGTSFLSAPAPTPTSKGLQSNAVIRLLTKYNRLKDARPIWRRTKLVKVSQSSLKSPMLPPSTSSGINNLSLCRKPSRHCLNLSF